MSFSRDMCICWLTGFGRHQAACVAPHPERGTQLHLLTLSDTSSHKRNSHAVFWKRKKYLPTRGTVWRRKKYLSTRGTVMMFAQNGKAMVFFMPGEQEAGRGRGRGATREERGARPAAQTGKEEARAESFGEGSQRSQQASWNNVEALPIIGGPLTYTSPVIVLCLSGVPRAW